MMVDRNTYRDEFADRMQPRSVDLIDEVTTTSLPADGVTGRDSRFTMRVSGGGVLTVSMPAPPRPRQ